MAQIIWTNHLRQRVRQRGINPRVVDRVIRFPDQVIKSRTTPSQKYTKVIDNQKITATVKKQGNDWIVTSVWKKPLSRHQKKAHSQRTLLERIIFRALTRLEKFISRRFKR